MFKAISHSELIKSVLAVLRIALRCAGGALYSCLRRSRFLLIREDMVFWANHFGSLSVYNMSV